MSFDCTCHIDKRGAFTLQRQPCIGHIDGWCGCGNTCPNPTLDIGRNAAKRERRAAKKAKGKVPR